MDEQVVDSNTIVAGYRLRRIPFHGDGNPMYQFNKEFETNEMENIMKWNPNAPAITAILTNIHDYFESEMNENGLEKLAMMMIGTLFMIQHNDVHHDWIYGTLYDIREFESGNYDDLVLPEDMSAMKKDIAMIKAYAQAHPELWDDSFSDEELARAGIARPNKL